MEETEQIKFDFPASTENKSSKVYTQKDDRLKKIEESLTNLERKVDVLYKSLRR